MLPRFDRRERIALCVCAAAQMVVVAAVAARQPHDGALAVAAALVLAPVTIAAVAATGARFRRGWFPIAAAAVVVLLPLLANRLLLAAVRPAFNRHALPALVGTQSTGVFAIGVFAVALAAVVPERLAAGLGLAVVVAAVVFWSPGALGHVEPMLHESAWSVAFPEWLVVATIAAVVLRRPWLGTCLGCLAAAAILRAAHHPFDNAGFWRALGPLAPMGALLLASLWLLVPRVRPSPNEADG